MQVNSKINLKNKKMENEKIKQQQMIQVQQYSLANENVFIAEVEGKGRGVFAARDFKKGELIEACPVVVLSNSDRKKINHTELRKYYYEWGAPDYKEAAVVLGFGFLYNHDYNSNAHYERDEENRIIKYVCIRDIKAGEEITVNYNGVIDDTEPVWFDKAKKLLFRKK